MLRSNKHTNDVNSTATMECFCQVHFQNKFVINMCAQRKLLNFGFVSPVRRLITALVALVVENVILRANNSKKRNVRVRNYDTCGFPQSRQSHGIAVADGVLKKDAGRNVGVWNNFLEKGRITTSICDSDYKWMILYLTRNNCRNGRQCVWVNK